MKRRGGGGMVFWGIYVGRRRVFGFCGRRGGESTGEGLDWGSF